MQSILLAAGFGTRLRPYTEHTPKPLFPVLNRPLLHILIEKLELAGCTSLIVNCHHLAEQIVRAVDGYSSVTLQVEPEILGTGGSLRQALPVLADEPVLVMNGDVYHDIDLGELYRYHQQRQLGVTMALHRHKKFSHVIVDNGLVRGFTGKSLFPQMAYTGVQVVDPAVIERIPADSFFHIIDLYRRIAEEEQIAAYDVSGCFWRDIGTPEDYLRLHRDLLTLQDSSWKKDRTARVGRGVRLKGWGCIGPGAVIGKGAVLENVVVWEGAETAANARICNSIITSRKDNEVLNDQN